MQEITHLDDLFEFGEIYPKGYRSERQEMMETGTELKGQLGGLAAKDRDIWSMEFISISDQGKQLG